MTFAAKNLRYLRRLRNYTQEEFASKLKIKRSLLGAYEEERAEPKIEVLEIMSTMFKVSLDELILKDLSDTKNSFLAKRRAAKLALNTSEIEFVPIKVAAGYLAGYADPEFIDELNTFTLPMLTRGIYRAFEIIGDSMLPTPSGSVIVGERVDDLDDVKSSNTYIVVSKQEGIVYKRILKSSRTKGKLMLASDNPSYQPYHIEAEDVLELWQAQMIITKTSQQNRWDVTQLANLVTNLQDQVSTIKKRMN